MGLWLAGIGNTPKFAAPASTAWRPWPTPARSEQSASNRPWVQQPDLTSRCTLQNAASVVLPDVFSAAQTFGSVGPPCRKLGFDCACSRGHKLFEADSLCLIGIGQLTSKC